MLVSPLTGVHFAGSIAWPTFENAQRTADRHLRAYVSTRVSTLYVGFRRGPASCGYCAGPPFFRCTPLFVSAQAGVTQHHAVFPSLVSEALNEHENLVLSPELGEEDGVHLRGYLHRPPCEVARHETARQQRKMTRCGTEQRTGPPVISCSLSSATNPRHTSADCQRSSPR